MMGARSDALEWALALAKVPGERLMLHQRRLPDGIELLLRIAVGGRGSALTHAVARTGESEQYLVDASRFYLREVLFHPDADAYRVLGLERGASAAQLKAHHRWLQQWLHPDRCASDGDAIFAGRVNTAWHQLRDEDRRRAYNAEHPDAVPSIEFPSMLTASWVQTEEIQRTQWERWGHRIPLLTLLLACVTLGVLAVREVARDEALVTASASADADVKGRGDARAVDNVFDTLSNWSLPERAVTPAADAASAIDQELPARVSVSVSRLPIDRAGSVLASSPSQVARHFERVGGGAIPIQTIDFASRENQPAVEWGGQPSAMPAPARYSVSAESLAMQSSTPALTQTLVDSPGEPRVVAAAPLEESQAAVTAESVRNVQQVGARLLAYLQSRDASIPPIWNTLSVQQVATRIRGQVVALETASVSEPIWRVGVNEAHMAIQVRYLDGRQVRLNADMVWREQRWLVSRLNMERDW